MKPYRPWTMWECAGAGVTLGLCLSRVLGAKSQVFQALAHLTVGLFAGLYVADYTYRRFFVMAVVATVVETIAFLWGFIHR